jgi:hypothetical protein
MPGLTNDVGQPFVVSVGKIALKRRGLDPVDGENREQSLMAAKWFLVQAHHATSDFLNRVRGVRGRSLRLF